jgi:hypothetical protein
LQSFFNDSFHELIGFLVIPTRIIIHPPIRYFESKITERPEICNRFSKPVEINCERTGKLDQSTPSH